MSIGQKIAAWREANHLTERQAADRARVSQPTWRAVEREETKRVGLEIARRIVAACDGAITLEDFPRVRIRRARKRPTSAAA